MGLHNRTIYKIDIFLYMHKTLLHFLIKCRFNNILWRKRADCCKTARACVVLSSTDKWYVNDNNSKIVSLNLKNTLIRVKIVLWVGYLWFSVIVWPTFEKKIKIVNKLKTFTNKFFCQNGGDLNNFQNFQIVLPAYV